MKAFIIAENSECNLAPLTDRMPHALLPVAGKSLLLHALEALHRSGLRDVTVVARHAAEQLRAATDTGPLLGMRIDFKDNVPSLAEAREHSLFIGLRELPDVRWPEVLERFGDLDLHVRQPVRMTVHALPVALLVPPGYGDEVGTDWADVHQSDALTLSIGPCALLSTGSLPHYFNSSFKLVRGEFRQFTPAGRDWVAGHRMAPDARVRPGSVQTRHGYLGQSCRVDKSALLEGTVIVGNHAVIGRGTRVTDSIVLDGTYLGANTHCRNAIVAGNALIRVDSGVVVRLDDPLLFGAVA